MKTNRTIAVSVSPTGEITIDAAGYHGSDCEEATRFLEEALGTRGGRIRKPQFFARRRTAQTNQQNLDQSSSS